MSLLGAVLVMSALAACNSLLDVPVPSRIPAGPLENPTNAELLTNGAISDFDCALGSFIVVGAELTDEFEDATATAARWVYDKRDVPTDNERYAVNDCDAEGTYVPINRARASADNVLRILNAATDSEVPSGVNRRDLIAQLYPYAGYARVLLGEMFCSAVISTLNPDGKTVTYGTELTPQQVFQSADSMFTLGIAAAEAVADTDALFMSYIGRARARLDLGEYDLAKADAQQVTDPDYVHVATASATTTRRANRIYGESNTTAIASSVGPRYQHMKFDGVADPRVPVDSTGKTFKDMHLWAQLKYTDAATSIPIASYDEAQLIIAEADARANDTPGAIAIIDALHTKAGIPTYTAAGGATDQASVMAQIVEERSRELFLEGQRLYDVIRFNLALQPAENTTYRNGGVYGPAGAALCLKLPDVERQNNPNLQ